MRNALKSRIFGTALGQALLRVQPNLSFRTTSLRNPEQAGLRANHIIADRLITRLCPPGEPCWISGLGMVQSSLRLLGKIPR